MKIIVISEETRQRLLSEDPMLDAIDSSKTKKEKELEKKQKEDELRKKKEDELKKKKEDELKKKNENDVIKKDNSKEVKPEKNEIKTDNNEVKPEKNEIKADTTEVKPEKNEIKKDTTKVEPPKPTNPSGKVIPKPKKPLMKNSPAAKAGIPTETRQKFANMNAAFQATKRKDSGYTKMDFIKDFPNSQTAKKFNKGERIPGFKYPKTKKVKAEPPVNLKDMSAVSKPKEVTIDDFKSTPKNENIKSSYEPYDLVLDYVISEGHASTLEEAHYVMMQMDADTIQGIVEMKGGPYIINQADVNARTQAFKNFQKGMKNKITGDDLYKLGDGVKLPKV